MKPRTLVLVPLVLALAACGSSFSSTTSGSGGGGGGNSSSTGTTTSSSTGTTTSSSTGATTSSSTGATTSSSTGATTSSSTGSSTSASTGAGGSCAGIDASFANVLAKPLSGCSGLEPPCHNAGAGNFHIDPADAASTWAAMVNVTTTIVGAGKRVVPGDPAHSFVYRKLTDDLGPNDGSPMPKPGGLINPGGPPMWQELPQDEIEIMRCWIAAGAQQD